MATIAPIKLTNAGAVVPFVATAVAGDIISPVGAGDLLIEFMNGHTANITVNIAPTSANSRAPGVGVVPIPIRSVVVPLTNGQGAFKFTDADKAAYMTGDGIAITYTAGNVALLVRAIA